MRKSSFVITRSRSEVAGAMRLTMAPLGKATVSRTQDAKARSRASARPATASPADAAVVGDVVARRT